MKINETMKSLVVYGIVHTWKSYIFRIIDRNVLKFLYVNVREETEH